MSRGGAEFRARRIPLQIDCGPDGSTEATWTTHPRDVADDRLHSAGELLLRAYDKKYFRLRVRDDGKGIREEIFRADGRQGHYGLRGMAERAELVGGKLTSGAK